MSENTPKFRSIQIKQADYRRIKKLAYEKDAKLYEIVAALVAGSDTSTKGNDLAGTNSNSDTTPVESANNRGSAP